MKRILCGMLALQMTHASFAADEAAGAVVQESVAPKLTTVKLPSSETLRERLAVYGNFATRTGIHKRLADQEKAPSGVVVMVETALQEYNLLMNKPILADLMRVSKPDIVRRILRDHPEAIKELEGQGFLKGDSARDDEKA